MAEEKKMALILLGFVVITGVVLLTGDFESKGK
jgi:hypothetical protein